MNPFSQSINLLDLVFCISKATDLVSKSLGGHHLKVAYAAGQVGALLGMNSEQRQDIVLAGLLHDIGAMSLNQRIQLNNFEAGSQQERIHLHGEIGYHLLKSFAPLQRSAQMIRFHHIPWKHGKGKVYGNEDVLFESHVIHLVDRAVVLLDPSKPAARQSDFIFKRLADETGDRFNPQAFQAFEEVASKDAFWLDLLSDDLDDIVRQYTRGRILDLDASALLDFTRVLSNIVDFRSKFTARHSAGVAAVARELSLMCGFTQNEARMMTVAGHLHDLGKLAVPVETLEKPGKLTHEEISVVRSHVYYSYRLFSKVPGLELINQWASLHHERLDGKGYPFGLGESELTLGARIMAVADVFAAVVEERPYRKAMNLNQAAILLDTMAMEQSLDPEVVDKLKENKEDIYNACMVAQGSAERAFDSSVNQPYEKMAG